MVVSRFRRYVRGTLLAVGLALASGCSTYGERVAPVPLPAEQTDAVTVEGAVLLGRSYAEPTAAERAFGFDIRGAGLLPVQFVVDNGSGAPLRLEPAQTFLLDDAGNAWPVLSAERASERVRANVEVGETFAGAAKPAFLLGAAGAAVGFAIGVITGEDVGAATRKGAAAGGAAGAAMGGTRSYAETGAEVRRDLREQSLVNRTIKAGELTYGFLFFPGKEEAESARALRLSFTLGEQRHTVVLPLRPPAGGGDDGS
ncbi:hypothetical protein H0Z60_00875 [Ectothiorhodospiraceae bacterium WFHF3C12]|nr:hypothetical protein [Ectothiorhodospiraceae bacterium WFHF3C12]